MYSKDEMKNYMLYPKKQQNCDNYGIHSNVGELHFNKLDVAMMILVIIVCWYVADAAK